MKNKNNILIILIVTLSALTVICVVLISGYANSAHNSEPDDISDAESVSDVSDTGTENSVSEPSSVPEESEISEISSDNSSNDNSSESSDTADDVGAKIADMASSLIGSPFVLNGDSPSGFDNSGFIYYVLRRNGYITCPRTTDAQSRMGARVDRSSLKPGDLVFFGLDGSGEANFGGIYIGGGKMVASLNPDTNVVEVDITTDYYTANFYGGISVS